MMWIIIVIIVGYFFVWMLYVLIVVVVIINLNRISFIGVMILVYMVKFLVCYNLIIYVFMYRKM